MESCTFPQVAGDAGDSLAAEARRLLNLRVTPDSKHGPQAHSQVPREGVVSMSKVPSGARCRLQWLRRLHVGKKFRPCMTNELRRIYIRSASMSPFAHLADIDIRFKERGELDRH